MMLRQTMIAVCLLQTLTLSFAQNGNVQPTFINVSDADAARHFNLSDPEWKKYQRYMALEGRYFYSQLDPVMVLGIIEGDPQRRAAYAEKWLQAERSRVNQQVDFANLVAKTQMRIYGNEKLVDFNKLPWGGAQDFNPDELVKDWQPPTQTAPPAMQVIPAEKLKGGDQYVEPVPPISTEFMPGDEVWLVVDGNVCQNCKTQLEDFLPLSQLTPIRIYGMNTPIEVLTGWAAQAGITNELLAPGFVTLKAFDDADFGTYAISASPNKVYHARDGKIVRELGEGGL